MPALESISPTCTVQPVKASLEAQTTRHVFRYVRESIDHMVGMARFLSRERSFIDHPM